MSNFQKRLADLERRAEGERPWLVIWQDLEDPDLWDVRGEIMRTDQLPALEASYDLIRVKYEDPAELDLPS